MNTNTIHKPKDVSISTLEEFMATDYESYEFVEGELRPMSEPTMEHGRIGVNIIALLHSYVNNRDGFSCDANALLQYEGFCKASLTKVCEI